MKVNDIFQSISGEVGNIPQGSIAWFIRFQGCNLLCTWCDTKQGQEFQTDACKDMTPEDIAEKIPHYSNVILTGGEPLLQNRLDLRKLTGLLRDKNCLIQIETNGTQVPSLPICHVFDYKTPSSGEHNKMMELHYFFELPIYIRLWVKFVIKNSDDLEFTIKILKKFRILSPRLFRLHIALSISSGEGVTYIMDRLNEALPDLMDKIVFNFQLHKHFNLK